MRTLVHDRDLQHVKWKKKKETYPISFFFIYTDPKHQRINYLDVVEVMGIVKITSRQEIHLVHTEWTPQVHRPPGLLLAVLGGKPGGRVAVHSFRPVVITVMGEYT